MTPTSIAILVRHLQTCNFIAKSSSPASAVAVCATLNSLNNWIISLVLKFLPTELMVVPVVAEVSVALPSGVVVQVAGAEGRGSIVAATVEHVAAVLPPLWPR